MSSPSTPSEWTEKKSNHWSHSNLPIEVELIPIGDKWDVQVTPLPDEMPWHSLQVNIRKGDEGQERKIAIEYMEEFSDIEFDIRKEYSNLSEERKILIAAIEAIQNLR